MISKGDIQNSLRDIIAQELHISASDINSHTSFHDLGLDSVNSIFLIGELEKLFGIDIDPMSVYDNPTIESFSTYLMESLHE